MFENEIWKDVVGYEGLYQVSNFGKVRVLDRAGTGKRMIEGRTLKPAMSAGYKCVALTKQGKHKTFKIHTLVCDAFLGKRTNTKIQCNHINGNKLDNRVVNLEYCTRSENGIHAFRVLGRSRAYAVKGEKHGCAKLTNEDVISIRKLYTERVYSQTELASIFNVRQTSISNIVLRKSWKHI